MSGGRGRVLGAEPGPREEEVRVLTATPARPALAMKHMDLKQMELDTAAAKVDELTKQLESLWSDSPTPPGSQAGASARVSRSPGPHPSPPAPQPPEASLLPPGVQARLLGTGVRGVGS